MNILCINDCFTFSDFKLQDVTNFLKTLPCHGLKLMKSGSDIISEGVISALENEVKRVVVCDYNMLTGIILLLCWL